MVHDDDLERAPPCTAPLRTGGVPNQPKTERPCLAASSSARYRYSVARLTPRYLAMSFEVWPEDRRMSSPLPTRYGPRNPAMPGLPRPHDLLRNVFHCQHLETCWHRSGDLLCGDCDPAIPSADAGPRGADAGTASKQQILRAVGEAGSAGGTTIVRFESNRAASQESSARRRADERVVRCRSAGAGHGCAGVDGVGVVPRTYRRPTGPPWSWAAPPSRRPTRRTSTPSGITSSGRLSRAALPTSR